MFKDNLNFIEAVEKSDGYSSYIGYNFYKYDTFIHNLKSRSIESPNDLRSYVTTLIQSRLFRPDLYLMVLDCDSQAECESAVDELNQRKIKHFLIESTPGRFWIICNFIAPIKEIIYVMEEIPGVDRNYIKVNKNRRTLVVRAYPKVQTPTFGDMSKLDGSPRFVQWVKDFKEYWETEEMDFVVKQTFPAKL